jgi:hypothetical protein
MKDALAGISLLIMAERVLDTIFGEKVSALCG